VDLLSDEPIATNDPTGYEFLINSMTELDRKFNMPTMFYGYRYYVLLKIVSKYVHMEWSAHVVNGILFYPTRFWIDLSLLFRCEVF
jgi:energy-coupling factor transporter ATP-binding protein EcfA2